MIHAGPNIPAVIAEEESLLDEIFIPRFINSSLHGTLFRGLSDEVRGVANQLLVTGWKFYIVDQSRGRCYHQSKVITIASWVLLERPIDYKTWYVCHEMAHAFAGYAAKHGPDFMKWLMRICPAKSLHHELGYKPRNAASAGIRKPFSVSFNNAADAL